MSAATAPKRPESAGGPPAHALESRSSGFEGKEELLGRSVAMVVKTLQNAMPYQHETNDALVKAHLNAIQFAKDQGLLKELVAHDIKTMAPLLGRIRAMIEKTGNKDMALVGIFDHTGCHYQLVLDTASEPGKRTYTSPFRVVLEAAKRIGQFDLTEEEIHNVWTVPRYLGYAQVLGVNMTVSPWQADGKITVEIVD